VKHDGDLTTRTVNTAVSGAYAALSRAQEAASSNRGTEAVWIGVTEVNLWIGVVGFTLDDLGSVPLWLAFKYIRNVQTHQSGWLLTDFEESNRGSTIDFSKLRWPQASELEVKTRKQDAAARQAYETVLAGRAIESTIETMLIILVGNIDKREKQCYDVLMDFAHETELNEPDLSADEAEDI